MNHDDIDFDAEVRVRGILGIPLMLLSELFAFHGTGTIAERVEDSNTMAVLFALGVQSIQGRFVQKSEAVVLG